MAPFQWSTTSEYRGYSALYILELLTMEFTYLSGQQVVQVCFNFCQLMVFRIRHFGRLLLLRRPLALLGLSLGQPHTEPTLELFMEC